MLVDPDEMNDWVAEFEIDLAESRAAGEPAIRLRLIASLKLISTAKFICHGRG